MSLFSNSLKHYAKQLERKNAELTAQLEAANAEAASLDQALLAEKAKPAAAAPNAAEIATALQRVLPSVVSAPGFDQIRTAPDASAFARGILALLYTARSVGYREALAPKEDA